MHASNFTFPVIRLAHAICVLLAASVAAFAETVTYHAQVGNEVRNSVVDVVEVNGMACVPLKDLVEQLGGAVVVESGTVKIALQGASAHIQLDDTRVMSTHNEFTIQQPVRAHENTVYIAVNDVAPLFSYGFKLALQSGDAAMPAPSTQTPGTPLPPQSSAGRKLRVVLDPGHGGIDPGENGPSGSEEKTIALAIALQTAKLLEQVCEPVLTRGIDQTLTTKERISAANVTSSGTRMQRGDVFVSIHTGASSSPTPSGYELFCPPSAGPGDANVQRSALLAKNVEAALGEHTGSPSRGMHHVPVRLFSGLQMPCVLVEVGFITNPTEEQLLVSSEYQAKIAQGIAAGVTKYIQDANR